MQAILKLKFVKDSVFKSLYASKIYFNAGGVY